MSRGIHGQGRSVPFDPGSKPPLVLVEIGNPDGLDDPVLTRDERVTTVSLDWQRGVPPRVRDEAIEVLEQYRGEHPRIDLILARLRRMRTIDQLRRTQGSRVSKRDGL